MRWDYGKVYQYIRKSKGLTQEEVCQEVFARSTLARIESGKVIPQFDTMMFLLRQIDMGLDEFEYICNYYQPNQRQKIINQLSNLSGISLTSDLEKLVSLCDEYLQKEHDTPIERIYKILKVNLLLGKSQDFFTNPQLNQLTQDIWNEIEKQDVWYFNDLKLLSTILYHFSFENIETNTQKILENLKKYSDYRETNYYQFSILMNLSTIYLRNDRIKEAQAIALWALEIAQKLKRFDCLGFAQVRLGICQKDEEMIKKGVALLKLTEENHLVASLENEIEQYYQP